MKLLVIASTFPASDADPVPAFVRDQVIALKALHPDLHISVLAPQDGRAIVAAMRGWPEFDEYRFHYFWPHSAEKLAGRGILPALRANPLMYLLVPFLFAGEFLAVLNLVRRLRPDVVYAHWFTPQAVVASWVGRITGTPFVFTTHASDVAVWSSIPLLGAWVVRTSTRRARAFTAVSRRSLARLQRFFSTQDWEQLQGRAAIIPMGVSLPDAADMQTEPAARRIILFLGRLVEKKGVPFLLQAFATVRDQLGPCELVIAGDGPQREMLRQSAAALGIADAVRFAGFVSGSAKSSLLRQADVFVVPSVIAADGDAEGLPVALLEGLAWGRVCIASGESGADDILTSGQDGFLVPQGDSAALAPWGTARDAAGRAAPRRSIRLGADRGAAPCAPVGAVRPRRASARRGDRCRVTTSRRSGSASA